ncbi:hypothetical protein C8Q72DRAFT_794842 [Fomitopsis betulina]|nr:hypothetical protein C8Q72DRAFT_794842 [Fomitopsis betulina]
MSQDPWLQRVHKICTVLQAMKENNWRSFNEFLLASYTSKDEEITKQARCCIAHTDGKSFPPEQILDTWLATNNQDTKVALEEMVTWKAADVLVRESTRACHEDKLKLTSAKVDTMYLATGSGLLKLAGIYETLLPCLWMLLVILLSAPNDYEYKMNRVKKDQDTQLPPVIVVIISLLLFTRNRATNMFQVIISVFLSANRASRRVINTCNHIGLSFLIAYSTIQRCLESLSFSAQEHAKNFIQTAVQLWGLVYDNINFTLRKALQRLDSTTQQLNATTSAVFSLLSKFTWVAYATMLSIAEHNKLAGKHMGFMVNDLILTPEKQAQSLAAFHHQVWMILLEHAPGLRKKNFFPLPALAQEEASVAGTIKVIIGLFTNMLGLVKEVVASELCLLVGDWLTIRNLRLVKDELAEEFTPFARMDWIQEVSMPFHFQLNGIYMLFCMHLGFAGDNDPGLLEHHRTLLKWLKLDPTKPEYNHAKELLHHSLIAHILDCTW